MFDPTADVDPVPNRKSSKSGVERMLEFGKELYQMSQQLEKEKGENEVNRKMLEVCGKWLISAYRLFIFIYMQCMTPCFSTLSGCI